MSGAAYGVPGAGMPYGVAGAEELLDAPPGVKGAIVEGVAGLSLPLSEVKKPPVRSAINRPKSPILPAEASIMFLSD